MQSAINNAYRLELERWGIKEKYSCSRTNNRYVSGIGRNNHGDMQTFNTIFQKIQTNLKKNNMTYQGDVWYSVTFNLISSKSWNVAMILLCNGEIDQ